MDSMAYLEALEQELQKIQVFHKEIPLCLELVTQAIGVCRNQVGVVKNDCVEIEAAELISSLETREREKKKKKKVDWLKSVKLWNHDFSDSKDQPYQKTLIESKKGGAFQPFHRDKLIITTPTTSTTTTTTSVAPVPANGINRSEERQRRGESNKKLRRSWSDELHRKFLHALQLLGGSHVATPKQIRELMNVDGLTNDEIKSHLQKYRLHTRISNVTIDIKDNPQPPQFIVAEGLLVSSQECTRERLINGVYAPVAARPQQLPSLQSNVRSKAEHSMEDDDTDSDCSASSSCTRNTTMSVSRA